MNRDLAEAIDFHHAIIAEGGKALVGYETAKALANVVLLSEIPTTYDKKEQRQVNAGKTWVKIAVDKVSMLRNPGKEELVVVTFDQDYRSNNLSNVMKKRQYWIREDGRWRIVYEGSA